MKKFKCLLFALLSVVTASAATSPNIVFVLIDDMGWNDLGYMGSDLYETPHIDALSAKGIRFTDAYAAAPLCSASRAAILTGWAPARQHLHGVTPPTRTKYESAFADYESWDVPRKMHRSKAMQVEIPVQLGQLPLSSITIAERLKEQNYATGFFGKWHLGPDADKHPDYQGFDVAMADMSLGFPKSYFSPYKNPNLTDGPRGEYLTDRLTDEACGFIREAVTQKQPFFCYLSHFAVHGPWEAKQEDMAYFKNQVASSMIHQNEIYAAMVKGVDDSIGKLQATLEGLGIEENTLIIFTSDNGAVGKKQTASDAQYVSQSIDLRGEKALTYEGGIRVPQFMVWAGQIEPAEVDEPVVGMDFYPTLLSVAGLEPTEGNPLDGVDLSPLFKGGRIDRAQLTFFMPHYMGLAGDEPVPSCGVIRQGDWKLIKFWEGGARLYNLKDDLVEQHDLSAAMPEKVAALETQLMAELNRQNAFIPAINPDWDEAAFEKYRARRGGGK